MHNQSLSLPREQSRTALVHNARCLINLLHCFCATIEKRNSPGIWQKIILFYNLVAAVELSRELEPNPAGTATAFGVDVDLSCNLSPQHNTQVPGSTLDTHSLSLSLRHSLRTVITSSPPFAPPSQTIIILLTHLPILLPAPCSCSCHTAYGPLADTEHIPQPPAYCACTDWWTPHETTTPNARGGGG